LCRKSSPGSPSFLLTENKNANYWRTVIKVGQNNVDNKYRKAKVAFCEEIAGKLLGPYSCI